MDGKPATRQIIGNYYDTVWQLQKPGGEIYRMGDDAPARVYFKLLCRY